MSLPQSIQVFLINLDSSDARLASATAQLARSQVQFTRIPAIDGRDRSVTSFPEYDSVAAFRYYGRELKSAEIGCYLSHLKAAQQFLDTKQEYGLVLEDDFYADEHAFGMLTKFVDLSLSGQIESFDLINLAREPKLVRSKIVTLSEGGTSATLYRAFYFPVIATALMWSRAGAEKFVESAATPVAPVDHIFRKLMCEAGRGLAFEPRLFRTTLVDSDIHGGFGPVDEKSVLGRRHLSEVRRQSQNFSGAIKNLLLRIGANPSQG